MMDDSGMDSEDDIPRDEQKRQRKDAKEKAELVENAIFNFEHIDTVSSMWLSPELQHLREFVRDISDDPTTYPPTTQSGKGASDQPSDPPQPTKGLAQKLVRRVDFPEKPKRDECPVIRVGRIDLNKKVTKTSSGIQGRLSQFRIWAMDGDGNFIGPP